VTKTRLLFVIPSLGSGGAERQMIELIKGLNKSIYDIRVIIFESNNDRYSSALIKMSIPVVLYKRLSRFDLSPLINTVRYIKSEDIDVVHTFLILGSLIGVIAARLSGVPVVCSSIREAKDPTQTRKYGNIMLSYISHYFVSNSQAGFDNRFKKQRKNFKVIYNGLDPSRFTINISKKEELRQEFNIFKDDVVIGMVASLTPRKDFRTLIAVASHILKQNKNIKFLLVGEGSDRAMLEKLSVDMGVSSNVFFTGYRQDVDQLINCFDILVLLTNEMQHSEGIPNTIIEAMGACVPVIASVGGGTTEIVKDNHTGLLVSSGSINETCDAINKLINDKEINNALVYTANKFVCENLSITKYVSKYTELYNALIESYLE